MIRIAEELAAEQIAYLRSLIVPATLVCSKCDFKLYGPFKPVGFCARCQEETMVSDLILNARAEALREVAKLAGVAENCTTEDDEERELADALSHAILAAVPARGEAREEGLRHALERIATEDDTCGCECDTENCCAVVGEYCAKCIARAALAANVEKGK